MPKFVVEVPLIDRRGSRANSSRTLASSTNSMSPSRSTGSRRSDASKNVLPRVPSSVRRTRSSVGLASSIKDSEDELTSDLSSLINEPIAKPLTRQSKVIGKATASRASTSNTSEDGEASGYSTPRTSAFATPASEMVPKTAVNTTGTAPAALNVFQRAKQLRNSEYALVPSSNKRKRAAYQDDEEGEDDEDEDENEDEDNSRDAQLARALQAQEDAKLIDMADVSEDEEITSRRRAKRPTRRLLPKIDYVDPSDDEIDMDSEYLGKRKLTRESNSKHMIPDSDSDSDDADFMGELSDDVNDVHIRQRSVKVEQKSVQNSSASRQVPTARKGRSKLPGRISRNADTSISSTLPKKEDEDEDAKKAISTSKYFERESTELSTLTSALDSDFDDDLIEDLSDLSDDSLEDISLPTHHNNARRRRPLPRPRAAGQDGLSKRALQDRARLEAHHPELLTMWTDLEDLPKITKVKAEQPANINRELKPFQLEGLSWMKAMEETAWGGGLLGDEMGMGKTIQAVSLIMSDYPAAQPSLVLIPPVALMQWQQEMGDYTNGTLKTFVYHGTNLKTKGITVKDLRKYDVILMSYNSLESMYRHQEKGFRRKDKQHFEKSVIHQIKFHRVILDEAHNIKQRTTGVAKACFALKADHKWCLSGTPLQNRIGEFFSLVRFLDIRPFACYFCKQCPCSTLEWSMNSDNRCKSCHHSGMHHVSVFNQELLNPIQKYGNKGPGKEAFAKLRLLTDRFMLRRVKRDHSAAMELPAKEIYVDRQFFGEEENDFAGSIMNNGTRKFETYVAQGVLLNNYANIFGLIMQMRQVADHPDLILKKNGDGGQNILVCSICDETAEDAVRSVCKHDFCRMCVKNYLQSSEESGAEPDCPHCHIPLAIDLEQPEIEQDEATVKKNSIINRIKMENWTSSSKIEALVYDIHALRSQNSSTKSIIFSQFTTMLQLVEWRLRRAGITTVMLDGSMTPAQRQASINAFMTNPNIECFLVSLKAGGVALNLTEASKVFIVDPWWNPAAEWQSADRCHRIGQCRPCSITRLCIEDSVESRMVLLQEKKANMINSTINNDESAMESLTPEDMQFLFRGT